MNPIKFKRGGTFSPRLTYTPPAGGLANLDGVTITSEVRARGRQLAALVVQDMDATKTVFTLVAVEGTDSWPAGLAEWDIRFAIGGTVFYSETAVLEVVSNVTMP